jgi:hypothetical protein
MARRFWYFPLITVLLVGLGGIAQGDDGDPLILGQENTANSATTVACGDRSGCQAVATFAFYNRLSGLSAAVYGEGTSEVGVWGHAGSIYSEGGVRADGITPGGSLYQEGFAPALDVHGVSRFDRSGVAIVLAGKASVLVNVPIGSDALIFATLRQNRPGILARASVPTLVHQGQPTEELYFRIYLTSKVSENTEVAWFIVNG